MLGLLLYSFRRLVHVLDQVTLQELPTFNSFSVCRSDVHWLILLAFLLLNLLFFLVPLLEQLKRLGGLLVTLLQEIVMLLLRYMYDFRFVFFVRSQVWNGVFAILVSSSLLAQRCFLRLPCGFLVRFEHVVILFTNQLFKAIHVSVCHQRLQLPRLH